MPDTPKTTTSWFCAGCGCGPMTIVIDTHCVYCGKRLSDADHYGTTGVSYAFDVYPPLKTEHFQLYSKDCCTCGAQSSSASCGACSHVLCDDCKNSQSVNDGERNQPSSWKKAEPGIEKDVITEHVRQINLSHESSTNYLQDPTKYQNQLNKIRLTIYELSLLGIMRRSSNNMKVLGAPCAESFNGLQLGNSPLSIFQDEKYFPDHPNLFNDLQINKKLPKLLTQMLQARDIFCRACLSLAILQNAHFIQNRLSILVSDTRPLVISLLPLYPKSIANLALTFSALVDVCLDSPPVVVSPDMIVQATACCNALLESIKLSRPSSSSKPGAYWLRTAYIIDLAIILYTAGHLGCTSDNFDAMGEYSGVPLSGDFPLLCQDMISLRSLCCLNPFLKGRKAWVFYTPDTTSNKDNLTSEVPEEFYLSTDIVTFSDVWGPAWAVLSEDKSSVIQYTVGNGSIIPWKTETSPQSESAERLCHWVPFNLMRDDQEIKLSEDDNADFMEYEVESDSDYYSTSSRSSEYGFEVSGDTQNTDALYSSIEQKLRWAAYARANPLPRANSVALLIGGKADLQLSECRCHRRRFRRRLVESHCIHPLGTHKHLSYVDSRSVGVSAAYQGIGIKADMTIKSEHRYFKEVLLERWEHYTELRHPKYLQYLGGVTVSLCTMNAKRCSILALLSSSSIRRLLDPFCWSNDDCGIQFWESVTSNNSEALAKLWNKYPQWQEEIGEAILLCLKHLVRTGLDVQRREYNVLWVYSSGDLPQSVVLKP